MSRAGSQLASWLNLAALANVTTKSGEVLVINMSDVVGAILAHLAARTEASAAATATTRSTWTACASTASLGSAEAAWTRISLVCVLRISHRFLTNFL